MPRSLERTSAGYVNRQCGRAGPPASLSSVVDIAAFHAMRNITRATMFLVGGLCWFAAALFFAVFAWSYVTNGAGLQFFGLSVSSGTVLLGLIHLLGFGFGAFLCFAIGVGLCAHGLVPPPQTEARRRIQPFVFIRELWARRHV